jgi:hypothetical protein
MTRYAKRKLSDGQSLSIHIWISMPNMENFYYDFTAIDPNKDISKTRQVHMK